MKPYFQSIWGPALLSDESQTEAEEATATINGFMELITKELLNGIRRRINQLITMSMEGQLAAIP